MALLAATLLISVEGAFAEYLLHLHRIEVGLTGLNSPSHTAPERDLFNELALCAQDVDHRQHDWLDAASPHDTLKLVLAEMGAICKDA